MKTVKIPYEYWAKIRNYKKNHVNERLFLYFYLTKINSITYRVYAKARLWFFILAFPFDVLAMIVDCLWNDGLRYFKLPTRYQTSSYIYSGCDAFNVCEELWNADTRSE